MDELSRADELTEPLALHTLQLLPELSAEDLADLQVQDSALAPLRDLLTRADPPSLDDLRALPQTCASYGLNVPTLSSGSTYSSGLRRTTPSLLFRYLYDNACSFKPTLVSCRPT